MVKVRLHVQTSPSEMLKTQENYELTRVPLVGELLSIEGGPLYVVLRVFHTPDRHAEGYHGEVWVRQQTQEEHDAFFQAK